MVFYFTSSKGKHKSQNLPFTRHNFPPELGLRRRGGGGGGEKDEKESFFSDGSYLAVQKITGTEIHLPLLSPLSSPPSPRLENQLYRIYQQIALIRRLILYSARRKLNFVIVSKIKKIKNLIWVWFGSCLAYFAFTASPAPCKVMG